MPDHFGNPYTSAEHRAASIVKYQVKASNYDATAERTQWIRIETIARLRLQSGLRVIDVGCGTGLSFHLLRDGVGNTGAVTGIEQSPDMVARSRKRTTTRLESHLSRTRFPSARRSAEKRWSARP